MADLFGAATLCPDSVVAWGKRKAEDFKPVAAQIAGLIAQACMRHLDETGFRVAGKGQWLHTASTIALTSYRVSDKRGDLPKGFRGGVVVHDHFKLYYALPGVGTRCATLTICANSRPWSTSTKSNGRLMRDLLVEANATVRSAVVEGAAALPTPVLRTLIKRYNAIVRRGLAFHRNLPPLARQIRARGRAPHPPGHNLLIRLHKFKPDVLQFLYDFAVPFTNNEAERDLRMMKVKMKISGGFRTIAGARIFARLRAVISTARKQGWNILQTLAANPAELTPALSP